MNHRARGDIAVLEVNHRPEDKNHRARGDIAVLEVNHRPEDKNHRPEDKSSS